MIEKARGPRRRARHPGQGCSTCIELSRYGLLVTIIDVDDCATWTSDLERVVQSVAEHHVGVGSTSSDLWLTDDDPATILAALDGVSIRVFHASRLLPFEVDEIRREGLEPASQELFAGKVAGGSSARNALASRGHRVAEVCRAVRRV